MSLKLLLLTLCLGLVLSCGKKAEESGKENYNNLTYSEAEINFYLASEIKRCIETNDLALLNRILDQKKDIHFDDLGHDGETLLTKAISLGHENIARTLINAGASIHISNINNETPLIVAVNKGLMNLSKDLLALGADPNKKDIFGDTALLISIKKKNEALAIHLIENGANILTSDRYSRSPYNLSRMYELENVTNLIKSILEEQFGEPTIEEFRDQIINSEFKIIARTLSRFNYLATQYEEINPLSLLTLRSNEDEMIEAAKLFLRWGTKINGPIQGELNPPLIESIVHLRFNYTDFLLDRGADVNAISVENLPALSYAIELNEPTLVQKLLNKGAKKKINNFDACSFTNHLSDEFRIEEDKQKNQQIKRLLSCSFRRWF
ncbi:MAG TPA: ankyrin repeat domain-containing protein [Bacteriovoracaceae bacterium]|nr:ankyrin repeat domain-containing protein [Bacteriovoracaceae bacterium]